jgi:hypothetical protein
MAQASQALAMAEAMAQAESQSGQGEPGQPGQGQQPSKSQTPSQAAAQTPTPGQTSALASAGGVSTGGSAVENQETPPGELQLQADAQGDSRAADSNEDAMVDGRSFADEPWFAKLPPTLRQAIQSNARRRPPRGYEERLRRYFQSVD